MNYLFGLTASGTGEGGLGTTIYFQELGQNVMAVEAYRERDFPLHGSREAA